VVGVKVVDRLNGVSCDVSECATSEYEYECSDGRCLERAWLCDGQNDCSSGEDELNCSTSLTLKEITEIRLRLSRLLYMHMGERRRLNR